MAIEVSGGSRSHRQLVEQALITARTVARLVAEEGLRTCILDLLNDLGSVVIEESARPGLLGWNVWTMNDGEKQSAEVTIHLCVANHEGEMTLLAETLVHEFAHACCWKHGDGAGVPE